MSGVRSGRLTKPPVAQRSTEALNSAAVDLATVTDLDNEDAENFVFDEMDDAVVSNPNA